MITSRSNSLIKLIRSLSDKSNRDENGLYTAEGIKSVKEAIATNQKIKTLVLTEKVYPEFSGFDIPKETVTDDVFKSISSEVSPQGAMAVIQKPKNDLIPPEGDCLFLDGVSDPSNIGAIIRTACASGYGQIYIADGADAYNPKSVRASMGGIFRVKIYSGKREDLIKFITLPIIIADMYGENVYSVKIEGKVCLVIGNEAHGVSELLKSKADKSVSIPMQNGMESLNAAVSAGILMYTVKNIQGE